jgi:nitroreductase
MKKYGPTDPKTGKLLPGYTCTVIPSARILKQAPVAVFIENVGEFIGNRKDVAKSKFPKETLVSYEFELLGIGAAIENIFLAAHAKDIGAVFMGDVLFVEDPVKEMFDIRGDLLGVVSLGYRRDSKDTQKRLKKDRVVFH